MNKGKREKLEAKGWRVGSVEEFLGLSPEESAYIEAKLSLSHFLQEKRKDRRLTQIQLAKLVNSSQSRVAKMEKSEPSVSIDLIVRSLFALGTGTGEIGRALIGTKVRPHNKRIEPTARVRHGARLRKRHAGSR